VNAVPASLSFEWQGLQVFAPTKLFCALTDPAVNESTRIVTQHAKVFFIVELLLEVIE
jgi:hypothetical protein